ncbi:MAG TPA: DUF4142 domain-containing protein [Rhodocyclaceae bacterium]|nr:DUF4142 domain-containing protein [Rhodocyclaceae bacterium]
MTILKLRTACAVLGLAAGVVGCNRQDNPPTPPRSMTSSQGTSSPNLADNDKAPPSGLPGAAPRSDGGANAAPSGERGMAGVAGSSAAGAAGPVAGADRAFMAEAANNSLAEVEAARLVEARTDNASIKSMAQQMERDYASLGDELKRLASQKGIELPTTIGGEPRGQLSRLTTLSKPEVDGAFLRDFGIDAHQKTISLFERQAREGQDADLKAFAERTLPKLREHLAMSRQMQGAVAGQAGQSGQAAGQTGGGNGQ